MGFSAGGIVAGSIASSLMSSAAVANGGAVAAGGLVATLQSVGAAGLGMAAKGVLWLGGSLFTKVAVDGFDREPTGGEEQEEEKQTGGGGGQQVCSVGEAGEC
ncbi:unnamed protein product [Lampetra fluviatilis]